MIFLYMVTNMYKTQQTGQESFKIFPSHTLYISALSAGSHTINEIDNDNHMKVFNKFNIIISGHYHYYYQFQ